MPMSTDAPPMTELVTPGNHAAWFSSDHAKAAVVSCVTGDDYEGEDDVADSLAVFCAAQRAGAVPDDIISRLIPAQGITLLHGQPRALKSWAALEMARSAATGTAAFGLDCFTPVRAARTWYVTEEDPAIEVAARLRCMLAGQSLGLPLFVSAQKGFTLDDPRCQDRLIGFARGQQIKLTIIDPLRAVSGAVDQGPREIQPLARFLRRFIRDTGSVLLLVHHDVKPMAGRPDDRAKPQRASGGGIFSIADAPIHAELIGLGPRAILTPSHYKFAVAPDPFIVRLDTDDPHRPTSARLVGEDTTAKAAGDVAVHEKIVALLAERPEMSGSTIAKALHVGKAQTLAALDAMRTKGLIAFVQRGQARRWTVKESEEPR
jgi:hypothetical protein